MTAPELSLAEQCARRVLTVSPGMDGFRLAFVGGVTFDPIASFPTWQAAEHARLEAKRLSEGWNTK